MSGLGQVQAGLARLLLRAGRDHHDLRLRQHRGVRPAGHRVRGGEGRAMGEVEDLGLLGRGQVVVAEEVAGHAE